MARVKRGVIAGARHKKILKLAKGYKGAQVGVFRVAKQAVIKAGQYAYRDRRQKKRQFRSLWITKINAAARLNDLSYSKFMNYLHKSELEIDRKVLADIAVNNPEKFSNIVKTVILARLSVVKINLTDLEALLTKDLLTCTMEHDLLQIKSKYLGKKWTPNKFIFFIKRDSS